MITRQNYLDNSKQDGDSEKWHRAYYAQFVTPTVKAKLETFLARGGKMGILAQVDRLALTCPADVAQLLDAAGDYPTLAGLVCIYKVAYELRDR